MSVIATGLIKIHRVYKRVYFFFYTHHSMVYTRTKTATLQPWLKSYAQACRVKG